MASIFNGILSTLLFLVLVLLSTLPTSLCVQKKAAAAPSRKEDIPFIKCQVCDKLARQIHHQVQKKAAEISPKKVSEFQIIEITEKVCNLKKQEADWILMIDIVEKGHTLELIEQDTEGQCNSECKTIELACQQVMGYLDTDISEYIYTKKPSVDALVNHLCHDLSKACNTKPPPVPKDRIPGEPFVPKSSKEAEMDRILKSMDGMPGAPNMKMYSREDLLNMNGMDGEVDEDDEEDDDDFPSKMGKVLREKDTSKLLDFKQRILQGVKETGTKLNAYVNRAYVIVKNWWRGRNKKPKHVKSGKSEL